MAETHFAPFEKPVPLQQVRIAALYPLEAGELGVVYGTRMWNTEGLYRPRSSPMSMGELAAQPSLRDP